MKQKNTRCHPLRLPFYLSLPTKLAVPWMDLSWISSQPHATLCPGLQSPLHGPAFVCFSSLLFHDSAFLECFGRMASFLILGHPQFFPAEGFGTCSLPGMLFPSSSPVIKEINRVSDDGHIWTSCLLISYISSNEMQSQTPYPSYSSYTSSVGRMTEVQEILVDWPHSAVKPRTDTVSREQGRRRVWRAPRTLVDLYELPVAVGWAGSGRGFQSGLHGVGSTPCTILFRTLSQLISNPAHPLFHSFGLILGFL